MGEISEVLQNLKVDLGVEVAKQKILQEQTLQTASKIQSMSHNLPNILRTIYMEDKERAKDNSQDQVAVIKTFENRMVDQAYLHLLERRKKD